MRRYLHHILFTVCLSAVALSARAQDNTTPRQIYAQAESDYQIGRLNQAKDLLTENLSIFKGNLRQNAIRLLSLCFMAQDSISQSETYAVLLLKENPYYTSVQDPIRFEEMVNRLRSGNSATITTASNQEESVDEAPVPVTLISEQMIKMSGARNLKELLITYVPGMSNVECNEEMNVAMRGIYSSGQEKILIMLNGHRMNSYSTNVARPDFAMSLDKVKQIEVLRGPASSLYGGVALTAVINIITKRGTEVDGFQVKGAAGNYGQLKGDAIFGSHYLDLDIMGWASIYNAEGQKYFLPMSELKGTALVEGDVIIGGYNHRPTYDTGITLKYKGLSLMHNTCFSKTVAPYTLSYFFSPYNYKKYTRFDGCLPGFANSAHHTEVSYTRGIGKFGLKASLNYDSESQMRYQVGSDLLPDDYVYEVPLAGTDNFLRITEGVFQNLKWNEENYGARLEGSYSYQLPGGHSGSIVSGAQYDYFMLNDAQNFEGDVFERVVVTYDYVKNLQTGSENSFNAFLQLKHKWNNFILNTGVRFDKKNRKDSWAGSINEWSPRLAVLFLQPKWNLKLSYSKSFVDAPYFYRYNTLDTYMGGSDLEPEYLHSIQLTFSSHDFIKGLQVEVNTFHNRATNLVHPEGMYYWNSGSMKNMGVELTAVYTKNRFMTRLNASWQHLISSENYKATSSQIYNIPNLTANLVTSYRITSDLNVYANINYMSDQKTTLETPDEMGMPIYNELSIPSRVIVNLGATYQIKKLSLGIKSYNTFNHHYEQGGTSIGPIQQQGMWLLGEIAYKL